jgi:hypothetical protein
VATELDVIEGGGSKSPSGAAASAPAPKKYRPSIYPKNRDLDPTFAGLILDLERITERKIWLLIHHGLDDHDPWDDCSSTVSDGFRSQKSEIPADEKLGLLIHSPGGQAGDAYQIVRLFQRRTRDFVTFVPLYAKSAATLVTVGGFPIHMGSEAELGPLDVQMYDDDKEAWDSALNVVQSFERLNAYALTAYDQAMQLLLLRTGKKPFTLMPHALQYATSIVGPLADKIDTFEVTSKSRELKVAEDYAVRIMRPNYPEATARNIARNLVERYSTHGFVIDRTEAAPGAGGRATPFNLGLRIADSSPEIEAIFTQLTPFLEKPGPINRPYCGGECMSNKKRLSSTQRAVSSREAVEAAIERSKSDRYASWEKPSRTDPPTPKWGKAPRHDIPAAEECDN